MVTNKKASIVKHRTKSAFRPHTPGRARGGNDTSSEGPKGKGKTGFKVGPSHAPDGAYLGRAKRIKADLIEKAKTKKRYYKEIGRQQQDGAGLPAADDIFAREEGRFAPESASISASVSGSGNTDYLEALEEQRKGQRRRGSGQGDDQQSSRSTVGKAARQARLAEQEAQRRIQGGTATLARQEQEKQAKQEDRPGARSTKTTEADRLEARQRRSEQWNAKSGSRTGRQRGQPNLGARMDLLLDRIQRES